MRNKILSLALILLLASILFNACKKDDDSTPEPEVETHPHDTCLVTKVYEITPSINDTNYYIKEYNPDASIRKQSRYYQGLNNPPEVIEYEYDSKGRLIQNGPEIYVYNHSGNLVLQKSSSITITMKYDEKNRLQERFQLGPSRYSSYNYYVYNDNDQLVIDRSNPSDTADRSETRYSYNTQGYLSEKKIYIIKNSIAKLYTTTQYEYDGNGNKLVEILTNSDNPQYNQTISYEYDVHNNVIKETTEYDTNVSTIIYERKYDGDGHQTYLKRISNGVWNYFTIYEYTCWD